MIKTIHNIDAVSLQVMKPSVSKPSKFLLKNLNSAVLCAVLAFAGASQAAINTKDSAFNSGNPVQDLLGGTEAQALDLEVTHDNKIYSVGKVYKNNKWKGYIARYNANGNLDTSFDGDGIAYSSSAGVSSEFNAVTLLPNGKVLVAEMQQPQARHYTLNVYRFNQDGSIDTTFGSSGKFTTMLSNTPQYPHPKTVKDIGVGANGRILVLVDFMLTKVPYGHIRDAGSTDARVYSLSADGRSGRRTHLFDYQGRGLGNVNLHKNYSRVFAESLLFANTGKIVVIGAVEQSTANSKNKAEILQYADENPSPGVLTTSLTYRGSFSANRKAHHWYKSAIKTVGGKVLAAGCTSTSARGIAGMFLTEFTERSGNIAKSNPLKEYKSTGTTNADNYCLKDLVQHPKNNKIISVTQGYGLSSQRHDVKFAIFDPNTLAAPTLKGLSLDATIKIYKMDIMPNGKIALVGHNTRTRKAVLAVYEGYGLPATSHYGASSPSPTTNAVRGYFSKSGAFSLNNPQNINALIYAGYAKLGTNWRRANLVLPANAANIQLRHVSGSAFGQTKSTALVLKNGNIIKRNNRLFKTNDARFVFSSSTTAPDTTPDSFRFTSKLNQPQGIRIVSNRIAIRGINVNVPISLTGGASNTCEYRISTNSSGSSWGAWGRAAGTVGNNSLVEIRCTTPRAFNRIDRVNLVVGSFSASFRFSTGSADTTPDSFSFTAKTNQELNRNLEVASSIPVRGINTSAPISITGGEYSIFDLNASRWSPWKSTPSTISNGQFFKVRHTTSNLYSTNTTTTLTIGGVSAIFLSTTKADPNPSAGIGPNLGSNSGGTGGGTGGSTGGGTEGGSNGGGSGGGATLPVWLGLFGLLALFTRKRRMVK